MKQHLTFLNKELTVELMFIILCSQSTPFRRQQNTEMLQENDYVAIISLDLSNAFDAVRHKPLGRRLASIPIPDEVYNNYWVVDFLSLSLRTLHQGEISSKRTISSSAVQGPALVLRPSLSVRPTYPRLTRKTGWQSTRCI